MLQTDEKKSGRTKGKEKAVKKRAVEPIIETSDAGEKEERTAKDDDVPQSGEKEANDGEKEKGETVSELDDQEYARQLDEEEREAFYLQKAVELNQNARNWHPDTAFAAPTSMQILFDTAKKHGISFGRGQRAAEMLAEIRERLARQGSAAVDIDKKYDDHERESRGKETFNVWSNQNGTVTNRADDLAVKFRDKDPYSKEAVFGREALLKEREHYRFEGMVGVYKEMLGSVYPAKFFQMDHQPQSDLIKAVAATGVAEGKKVKTVAAGRHSQGGLTICLHDQRHIDGATYGKASPFVPMVRHIDQSADSVQGKITQIKGLLNKAANSDADEVLSVYADHGTRYADVDRLALGPEQKAELKTYIEDSVKRGEARIKAQTFDEWFEDE